jgi:hypothetical protein
MTEDTANQFVSNARGQWEQLVRVARATTPKGRIGVARTLAEAAGVGVSTLRRKLEALHMAMNSGLTDDELIKRGQRWVMARFVSEKKNGRTDEQVVLKWLVSPELRDAAHENFVRIGKLLNMTTSNEVWTFLISQMTVWTDAEILHAAGELSAEKRSHS